MDTPSTNQNASSDQNDFMKVRPLQESAVKLFFESLSEIRQELESESTAEIMINDPDNVWVEQRGVMKRLDIRINPVRLHGAVSSLASSVEKSARAGTDQGIINAGHKGFRFAAVMKPTAIDGHALSIRKHRETNYDLDDYVRMGAFSSANARPEEDTEEIFVRGMTDERLRDAIRKMVQLRKNVLIAGGTSTGKTTFLNAVAGAIPDSERVITIEDTQELKIKVPNRVRLLSNEEKKVTPRMLVALCLRFRPDRIVVGEVRGGEAFDMLQALNTGHDGGMASIHANTGPLALSRLESVAMLGIPPGSSWTLRDMRKNIAECFHYVVHLKRTGELRHVSEIVEIKGFKNDDYILNRVF
jgi:pilus assembly protein CpaF